MNAYKQEAIAPGFISGARKLKPRLIGSGSRSQADKQYANDVREPDHIAEDTGVDMDKYE